jgi:hypothetical protein
VAEERAVSGPNLVDTKVEIVFSQPSQVLVEEEVSMALSMLLEIQKMVAVVAVVVTETLVELGQQIKGLGEEVAQMLQLAILAVVVVVHLPLAAMGRGKMAAMVVQEPTHQQRVLSLHTVVVVVVVHDWVLALLVLEVRVVGVMVPTLQRVLRELQTEEEEAVEGVKITTLLEAQEVAV